jgi:hypothetical protein
LRNQLRHDLEQSHAHIAEINWVRPLVFPEPSDHLQRDLEAELQLQLDAQPGETVEALLRRHSPQAVPPGRRPMLWLDWGTFGGEPDRPARPTETQLEDWLHFASGFLAGRCPDDLRIVCSLALEAPAAEYEAFLQQLQRYRRQPWCRTPTFRLSDLSLDKVVEDHLLEYLVNSTCHQDLQAQIAELLIAKTGGRFAATVALLEEAESGSGSWYDLLGRLQQEPGHGAHP